MKRRKESSSAERPIPSTSFVAAISAHVLLLFFSFKLKEKLLVRFITISRRENLGGGLFILAKACMLAAAGTMRQSCRLD